MELWMYLLQKFTFIENHRKILYYENLEPYSMYNYPNCQ